VVRPPSPERYEIRFTASGATREKLRVAQDLLGHAIPSGDIAQVFDRALTLLVADLSKKKFAATERPRRSRGQSDKSRNIPAEVQRGVDARDVRRCRFVALDGRRCDERRFLEYHHVIPHAAGGQPTVDNIELRCRAHNGYEVTRFFGPGKRRTRDNAGRDVRAADGRGTRPRTRSGTTSRRRREGEPNPRSLDAAVGDSVGSTPPASTSAGCVTRLRAR
jgi:HNH endonuclease